MHLALRRTTTMSSSASIALSIAAISRNLG
jgi:hypothetical protein